MPQTETAPPNRLPGALTLFMKACAFVGLVFLVRGQ